jgi:hypothetical protein
MGQPTPSNEDEEIENLFMGMLVSTRFCLKVSVVMAIVLISGLGDTQQEKRGEIKGRSIEDDEYSVDGTSWDNGSAWDN